MMTQAACGAFHYEGYLVTHLYNQEHVPVETMSLYHTVYIVWYIGFKLIYIYIYTNILYVNWYIPIYSIYKLTYPYNLYVYIIIYVYIYIYVCIMYMS